MPDAKISQCLSPLFVVLFLIKQRWPKNKSLEEHFTFNLQFKHSGTFAIRKHEELSYLKNQKMCDPILVTLLKMRPHYSQSSRENATPSSGTCPLASYKEVSPRVLLAVTDVLTGCTV